MVHSLKTVEWKDNKVVMIDQTKLPNELVFVEYDDYNQVADTIRMLVVRVDLIKGINLDYSKILSKRRKKGKKY